MTHCFCQCQYWCCWDKWSPWHLGFSQKGRRGSTIDRETAKGLAKLGYLNIKKECWGLQTLPEICETDIFSFRTLSVVLGADSRVGPMPKLGLRNIILVKSVSFIFLFCILFKGSVLLSMNLKECDSKPVPQPFVLEYHLGSLTAAPLCPTIHTVHLELKGIELRGPMRCSALSSPANPAFASSQPPCPVCV